MSGRHRLIGWRSELKYLVPEAHMEALRVALSPFVGCDPHGLAYEGHGYPVRSIYLDTPSLRDYHEKQAGIKVRRKLRIRCYDLKSDDDPVFFEIKRKQEDQIGKDRVLVRYRDIDAFLRTGDVERYVLSSDPKMHDKARHFLFHVHGYRMRPTSLTVYEREAFAGLFDPTLCITFDRNLRGKVFPVWEDLRREEGLQHIHPGFFVLEVKFNTRFPAWLTPVLGRYGLRTQSVSKYCLCLETGGRDVERPNPFTFGACYRTSST